MAVGSTRMKYELTVNEALIALGNKAQHLEATPDHLMADVDGMTAFNLGYAQAIHDLKEITEKDPLTLELVVVTEGEEDGQERDLDEGPSEGPVASEAIQSPVD